MSNNQGLFGTIVGGSYLNVHISNANVKGESNVGVLAGYATNVTISNCHTSGTVYGDSEIGGLAGVCNNCGWVNACSSSGEVTAEYDLAGGLFGKCYKLRNCFSRCNVTGNRYSSGGLTGNCSYLENCYAIGDVTGLLYKGGLTGGAGGSLKNCYTAGHVSNGGYACMSYGGCGFRAAVITGTTSNNLLISNCYGLADNYHPLYGIDEAGTIPIVSNTVSFTKNDNTITLSNSVAVGDNHYTDLLDALNAWVDTYDTSGVFLHWVADTMGENGGFPMFEDIRCYAVTLSVADSTPNGTVSGAGTYMHIDSVIISASADYGFHFMKWNDGNTDNPRIINLTQDTVFTAFFEKDLFRIVGTGSTQINYSFDFEDISLDKHWTLQNSYYTNRWYISTPSDTNRILYISKDNGQSNTYSTWGNTSCVFAYTTMCLLPGKYNYSYTWHGPFHYWNFMRVVILPDSIELYDSEWSNPNTFPSSGIALHQSSFLSASSDLWTNNSNVLQINKEGNYKLIVQWYNDGSISAGSPTAAAIDNIQFFNNTQGENDHGYVLGSDTVPYLDTVILTAFPNEGYRFIGWHDGNTDNPRIVRATSDQNYIAMFECVPYYSCDSIVVCGSYTWHDSVYTASTLLVDSLTNKTGCDSVIAHHLTIYPVASLHDEVTICETDLPYHYTNGAIDTIFYVGTPAVSTYTFIFTTINGCDSTVTLHLTVNQPTFSDTTVSACGSFDWYEHTGITASGDYTHVFKEGNAHGCDSIVTLHLTVNQPTYGETS